MRAVLLVLVLVGACKFDPLPSLNGDGGGSNDDGGGSGSDACVGIGCNVVTCDPGDETTISGRVFMPNGTAPLANVDVYVPGSPPGPIPTTLQCQRCGPLPGDPVVKTRTGADGSFRLVNAPPGDDIPVVITTGKWRRQLRVPRIEACDQVTIPATESRLPKNRTEGDMPRLAVVTGNADALECVVRKLGIDDSEFGIRGGPEPVHMFTAGTQGGGANRFAAGPNFPDAAAALWGGAPIGLPGYDAVLLSCEGNQNPATKPQAALDAMKLYADMGGRIFAAHFHNVWIGGVEPSGLPGPQVWRDIARFEPLANPNIAMLDTSHPAGAAFAQWMMNVGASGTSINFPTNSGRASVETVLMADKIVQYAFTNSGGARPQLFTFETPVESAEPGRCGRVVFSDMHQSSSPNSTPSMPFPQGCTAGAMPPAELAIAYMIFDMQRCNGAPAP
jgi:hypothetical protein